MAQPPAGGCSRRVDRTSVRTAAALLAKAASTPYDAEALAFVEGTAALLGRILPPAVDLREPETSRRAAPARTPRAALAAYAATEPRGTRLDLRG